MSQPARWMLMPKALVARPRLMIGFAVGVAAAAFLVLIPNHLSVISRGILAWDIACAVFLSVMLWGMTGCTRAELVARAEMQDEGAGVILALGILAAIASLVAIGVELSEAKGSHGWIGAVRIGFAFVTVLLSWGFVQIIFALHYAHEYFGRLDADPSEVRGGLGFPGDGEPDYWDFLHFAFVIGVAGQTADITFTSKTLRRIGTIHSVLAFGYNTIVLALTINLTAGLFG